MNNDHPFTLGQMFTGNQGIGFEVVSLDPLQVKCIEATILENWTHGPGSKFVLGKVYSLKMSVQGRHYNFTAQDFGKPAPWVSLIEDGSIQVH
jgi:hypothetical protein